MSRNGREPTSCNPCGTPYSGGSKMARGDKEAVEAERARVRKAERMALADQLIKNTVKMRGLGPDDPIEFEAFGIEADKEPQKQSFFKMVGNRMMGFRKK
jgi:hypothetical protein